MNISPELAQAILNYLANRPYGEVFQLINAIQAEAAKATASEQIEQPAQE